MVVEVGTAVGRTAPHSLPGTAAGTADRAPPRRGAGARGRSDRPPAGWPRPRSPRCRDRRTAPGCRSPARSEISTRHRTHSPRSSTTAVPVTSTPSTTDSSRRSSSIGDPGGTPITSMPRSAGAGTDVRTTFIAPARRPSSWVSRTNPERGSNGRCGELIAIPSKPERSDDVVTDVLLYRRARWSPNSLELSVTAADHVGGSSARARRDRCARRGGTVRSGPGSPSCAARTRSWPSGSR